MGSRYAQLTYRGDVTESATPGRILGQDEVGRFYEVIDADYSEFFDDEHEMAGHTHVNLQYASPETIKRELARLEEIVRKAQR